MLRTGRLSLSQADARPQLQANLLGQQKSDLPRKLDAIRRACVGKDRAHDTLEGARPRGGNAAAEDQVILNAAHSGDSLRDELGDRELPGAESLIERAQGIERLLDGPVLSAASRDASIRTPSSGC